MPKPSRPLRIEDKEYAEYAGLAKDIGLSIADTLRLQLREGAPIVRRKLKRKKK